MTRFSRWLLLAATLFTQNALAAGRDESLLYDPEPPADSAYVRLIHVGQGAPSDVWIDGALRIRQLAEGEPSVYLILPKGRHDITLYKAGEATAYASSSLQAESARALTVAFGATQGDPLVFEDKANTNRLKAVLAAYRLDAHPGTLDILSADGKAKVFPAMTVGSMKQRPVNPVTIELIATASGDKTALATTRVAMVPGGTYSILLLPGPQGTLVARTVQNSVERYTRK